MADGRHHQPISKLRGGFTTGIQCNTRHSFLRPTTEFNRCSALLQAPSRNPSHNQAVMAHGPQMDSSKMHMRTAAVTNAATATGSLPSVAPEQGANSQNKAPKQGAVIVGGGPAGIAAALMLARRGWSDITVLEKRDALCIEERDRSYV